MNDGRQHFKWSMEIKQHRSLYRFGGLWIQSLLIAVPWINALILFGLLSVVHGRMTVTPGVVVDLPQTSLREGMSNALTVLMISVSRETQIGDETLVFFDDERYVVQDDDQMALFEERIKARTDMRKDLLLLADRRVPHGDVIRFVNRARQAGIQRINIAEKPE